MLADCVKHGSDLADGKRHTVPSRDSTKNVLLGLPDDMRKCACLGDCSVPHELPIGGSE